MINRILIRIKVIQTLYSYLLVEKPFSLEGKPTQPTKEKRFAYSLYQDMIVLLVKLARAVEEKSGNFPLVSTRFISRLLLDENVNALLARYRTEDYPFAGLIPELAAKVKESAIYKTYIKNLKKDPSASDENLWKDIFGFVVMADPRIGEVMASRTNYTLKGVERMHEMMNRTFSDFLVSQDDIREVEKALGRSLDKARELYLRLLALPVDITNLQERILDDNQYKFLKSEEDINPNLRFVENRLIRAILADDVLEKQIDNEKINWLAEDPVLVRSLLKAVLSSDVYKEYMEAPESDLQTDCQLWRNLYKKVILDNPEFLEALETKSVFWNDDLDILSTFVLKSFRHVEEGKSGTMVFDKFKDEEDKCFGTELLRSVYKNKDTYRRYINDAVAAGKWDTDRLAFMDMVILITALAEIMNFPKIPLVVSINEYIELAKSYSTAKSGAFVNGVLDRKSVV